MAYSELPWRPFLGHQAWSWTTLRRGNVFLLRLQTVFLFRHVFYVFNVFKFLFERFYIYGSMSALVHTSRFELGSGTHAVYGVRCPRRRFPEGKCPWKGGKCPIVGRVRLRRPVLSFIIPLNSRCNALRRGSWVCCTLTVVFDVRPCVSGGVDSRDCRNNFTAHRGSLARARPTTTPAYSADRQVITAKSLFFFFFFCATQAHFRVLSRR